MRLFKLWKVKPPPSLVARLRLDLTILRLDLDLDLVLDLDVASLRLEGILLDIVESQTRQDPQFFLNFPNGNLCLKHQRELSPVS